NMGQLNRGVAYSSRLPYQLLNVPAKDMSLFPDAPGHFLNWLNDTGYTYKPDDFAPRDFYGRYISETFANETEKSGHKLSIIPAEVTGISRKDSAYEITSGKNETIDADKIILCTGNFPPGDVPGLPQSVRESKNYISHPWGGFDVNRLSSRESILMVGSGLTMLDLVLSLNHNDHIGKITVISRRGLLPLPHGIAEPYELSKVPSGNLNTSQLLTWVKDEVELAESNGKSWRAVTDAIRPYIQQLWGGLSLDEKKKFLRHLRPFWEIHRHKMPVESLTILNRMKQDGRLQIIAGRIKDAALEGHKVRVTYAARNSSELKHITADHIINCTGPETEYRKLRSSLFNSLVENKLAEPDELSLGLKATKQGFIIDAKGNENSDIAVVGPPAKGVLWECTALREIREQAALVVQNILSAKSTLHS
ncbi:MAG TPA: FAD/NAD(P)-binding protein, partial [Bacteroidia bacterium]|nr:FAD/NAD(P)-binding protein [Bacteroidia bacterium]